MHLLSQMSYKQHLTFILLFFLLFGGFSCYSVFLSDQESIHQTKQELMILPYVKEVLKLNEKVALHEIFSGAHFFKKNEFEDELHSLQEQIKESFNRLVTIDNLMADALKTTSRQFKESGMPNLKPIEIQKLWNALSLKSFEISQQTNFALHRQVLEALNSLLQYINGEGLYSLENKTSSYYLSQAFLYTLPKQIKNLSNLLALLYSTSEQEGLVAKEQSQLELLSGILSLRNQEIGYQIQRVLFKQKNDQPTSQEESNLKEFLFSYLNSYQTFKETLRQEVSTSSLLQKGSKSLFNQGLATFSAATALNHQAVLEFENLQKAYLRDLYFQRGINLAVSLGSLSFALALSFLFIKRLSQSLNHLYLATNDTSKEIPLLSNTKKDKDFQQIFTNIQKIIQAYKEMFKWGEWAKSQINSSMNQIAFAVKEQEKVFGNQEASIKQITLISHQISKNSQSFAKMMSDVSAEAEQTSSLAISGKLNLSKMEEVMKHMVEASSSIASKLLTLNEKTTTVNTIISTISKVADQTKLLSLKAAIEAEKAGKYGRSFSVIAREIRRLADQIAIAALDIEKMVNEMVSAVLTGVMGVEKFSEEIQAGVSQVNLVGEFLSKIIERVQQLTSDLDSVNQGAQAQSLGAEQIHHSIELLNQALENKDQTALDFQKTVEHLGKTSQELQKFFK